MTKPLGFILIVTVLASCSGQNPANMNATPEGKNRLVDATSPYLLQHADNPVDWYPWGQEALNRAKVEDKPILLSIGYSSCHWCHVMAHESFEDTAVARVMNENFVNIKLDREERPDIDQIYMNAVQAMGIDGGWPLNVFITPEQKPFYGGTYFPKQRWLDLLDAISGAFQNNREKLNESADKFAEHIAASEVMKYGLVEDAKPVTRQELDQNFQSLSNKFDVQWGGIKKAPKFPMPAVWNWLLTYYHVSGDPTAKAHLLFTLDKIAAGGIYDHLGGGFARYSVDEQWHVPHFEKMLYDNGQLLSLYAKAYQTEPKDSYRALMDETIQWLEREMLDDTGGLYAALDADSEGVEGKFYVWSYDEVAAIAGDHLEVVADYYDISEEGNWEETNVLRTLKEEEEVLSKHQLTKEALSEIVSAFKAKALTKRAERIRPGLDSKLISGWNGLALTGLCDVYLATGSEDAKTMAQGVASFLKGKMIKDGKLLRTHQLPTQGFLEDYAAVIQAFVTYYETFFDESFLLEAKRLSQQVIDQFYDENEKLFFYTSTEAENLIARKKELFDNVIPSSNSIMAENLYRLAIIFDDPTFLEIHKDMVSKVKSLVKQEPEYMSNWGITVAAKHIKQLEIVVIGPDYEAFARDLQRAHRPHRVVLASAVPSELPLMEYKTTKDGETTIYVCSEKVCRRPVTTVEDAFVEISRLTGS
ncbi:MAG: thioredoxin domain-containing protein [Bacteroidota bacterium]